MDMMNMLSQMSGKGDEFKKKLDDVEVEGEAANGKVKVKMDGHRKVKSIKFADDLSIDDKEELEDLMIIATNKASDKAEEEFNSVMQNAAREIMPGMGQ